MKKNLAVIIAMLAAVLWAADMKKNVELNLNPEGIAVKAGTVVHTALKIRSGEGYTARNWNVSLTRRNTPDGFFEKLPSYTRLKGNARGYDHVELLSINYLPAGYTVGTEVLNLNTQGFLPGDYAIGIRVDFISPGKKTLFAVKDFFLSITEGDGKIPLILQENVPFFQSCKAKKTEFTVKSGQNAVLAAEIEVQPRCSVFHAEARILRKDLPEDFAKSVQKWSRGKISGEDEFELGHNGFRGVHKGIVYCVIPSGKLPPGTYPVKVRFKGEKSGGSFRRTYTAEIPAKITVKP